MNKLEFKNLKYLFPEKTEINNKGILEINKNDLSDLVKKYGWHLSIKAALEVVGHFPRTERLPMLPLNDEEYYLFKSEFEKIEYKKYLEYLPNN